MNRQSLLFLMTEETPDAEIRQMAAYAADHEGRLVCCVVSQMPVQTVTAYGAVPYGGWDVSDQWVQEVSDARARLAKRAGALEALLQAENAAGDVQIALCNAPDLRTQVARRALVCDVAIAARDLRDVPDGLFRAAAYGVLFDTPIPLILNATPMSTPKRIFVGWDTDLPAARAIHAALPMLITADEVVIASFDPEAVEAVDGENPGSDLATWLGHHGCTITVNQYPSGGEAIGAAMQHRAAELGADLIVMGAYGRSRMRELVFGGTTRTMIEQTEIPVLMAH